jgi:hypothetical protein
MLYVYVSTHCVGCRQALSLVEWLCEQRPCIPVRVVDVDAEGDALPREVIGTPMYLWDRQVLFMGNPTHDELLRRVDHHWQTQSAQPLCGMV